MKKAMIQTETLTCPSCMQKIENGVKSLEGVNKESVRVLFNSSKVKLTFDDDKVSIADIENVINRLGYEIKKSQERSL
ncbi:heavy-metal-associated domain-containing protein [Gottschalkiaceae bacterium SANA]|nr:heavy-metal-associated domain-containing protein [Gottschalkiaceae bacterium SANA]